MSIELHGPAWAWILIGLAPFLIRFLWEAWKDRAFWRDLWRDRNGAKP